MAYEIVKPDFPFPAPYLASVGIDEAILDECCIKKGVVKKLDSRQAVTVEIDSVEYENVPVWIHTDCGARLAAIKAENDEEVLASDYFKDAALMFPFPEDSLVQYSIYDQFYTLEPQVLIVVRIDGEGNRTALGVIGIVQNIRNEFPEDEAPFRTYRPYIHFRLHHWYMSGITLTTTYSRHFLWDVLEDKIAEVPTWNTAESKFELPLIPLEDILDTDLGASSEMFNFLSGSIEINDCVLSTLNTDRQGTTATGRHFFTGDALNFGAEYNLSVTHSGSSVAKSYCEENSYDPGWELISGDDYDTAEYECKCGYGEYSHDLTAGSDIFITSEIRQKLYDSSSPNIWNFEQAIVKKFYTENVDVEGIWHPQTGPGDCGYYATTAEWSTDIEFTVIVGEDDPVVVVLTGVLSAIDVVNPELIDPVYQTGSRCTYGWFATRDRAGKLLFSAEFSFRNNFFMEGESYNLIQVATFTRHGEQEMIFEIPVLDNSILEASHSSYGFEKFDIDSLVQSSGSVSYMIGKLQDYHDTLIFTDETHPYNFYGLIENQRIANSSVSWEYYYMFDPSYDKPHIDITIEGLHFVPFNMDIALLETS